MEPDPKTAAAPAGGTGASDKITGQVDRTEAYRHDPARCVTCSGVQHRDTVADLWWAWGAGYRQAVAA